MRFMHCMITVRFNNCDAFTAQHTATWHHSQCNCVHMQYLSTISFHDVDKQWFWWTEAVPKQTQCTPFKQHSVNKTMNQFTRSPICFGLTWVAGHHRMWSHHITFIACARRMQWFCIQGQQPTMRQTAVNAPMIRVTGIITASHVCARLILGICIYTV
jgi:hypothetical protein